MGRAGDAASSHRARRLTGNAGTGRVVHRAMARSRSIAAVAALMVSALASADESPEPPVVERGTLTLGGGYTPDDLFFVYERVENTDLFHTGQGLLIAGQLTTLRQSAVLRHELPLGGGLSLQTELFAAGRVLPGFDRRGEAGSLELGQAIGR